MVLGRILRAHLLHPSALKYVYIHLSWTEYFRDPREYLSVFNNLNYQGTLDYLSPNPFSLWLSIISQREKKITGHQVSYNLYDLYTLLDHPLLPFLKVYR